MLKFNTESLTGPALDYAVAVAAKLKFYDGWQGRWESYEGGQSTDWFYDPSTGKIITKVFNSGFSRAGAWFDGETYSPSTDWAQGGPFIEPERINVGPYAKAFEGFRAYKYTPAGANDFKTWRDGPTPLIAAMRCFVASKLGDTVDIPEVLA